MPLDASFALSPGPWQAVGLMIGTSLDGIDAAWVECEESDTGLAVKLRSYSTLALHHAPAARLRALASGDAATAEEWSSLRFALARDHERAVRAVLGEAQDPARLDWVGAHGVTVAHFPGVRGGHGWQLHCGAALAAWLECPVVDDFRSADIARGGEGAPLAPVVDRLLRSDLHEDRAVLNLGGIANVTLLPAGDAADRALIAADIGPANLPLDGLRRRQTKGAEPFDREGQLALKGRADMSLRDQWLDDAWVRRPVPRSFGREEFGDPWLDAFLDDAAALSDADQMATLVSLEAEAVRIFVQELSGDWRVAPERPLHLLVTGGGRRNRAVMRSLAEAMPEATVEPIEAIGVDGDAKEAIDFAVLGYLTRRGLPAPARRVTGAREDGILGSLHFPKSATP